VDRRGSGAGDLNADRDSREMRYLRGLTLAASLARLPSLVGAGGGPIAPQPADPY
jgi:hypothetical protein